MKPITQSVEVLDAYNQIEVTYYMLAKKKTTDSERVGLLRNLIELKKFIEADVSEDETRLGELVKTVNKNPS